MTTEAAFYRRAEEGLDRMLELNPVAATQLGDHRWDDRLSDSTLQALEEQHQELLQTLETFEEMDTGSFGTEAAIDYELMIRILQSFVRNFEKVEGHRRNPGSYLGEVMGGVFMLILRDFAPLSERLDSALGRVREVPRVLKEGKANLIPERIPPVWVEIAVEQARQAPALFTGLLPALAAQGAPELQEDLMEAGGEAAEAIQDYTDFLENEVLPQAQGDFAAGEALFNEKLREEHLVDYDAEELLEIGWEQFRQTRAALEALVKEIDPDKSVKELLEEAKADHPTAEGLLDAYREAMDAARQYVIDHDIVTIPEDETLRIVETPTYLRPIIPYAAYMQPGILEEEQEGIFLVTPVDPDAPEGDRERKLRGHHWAKLPITALHEAYPGHHLQLVWANRQEKVVRRMGSFLSPLFIEGWAFYCEELMEELGYIADPIQRLGRLSDQLWRAARIILDVSLHTKGMSVEEAVEFLVEECRLEPGDARAEVRRYTNSPTQPQSYLMGKLAILDLVEEYRSAHPQSSLREIHDDIMGCGSLPPRMMRRQLMAQ
ncbi:MAG: DUF885 domain-containing protein [Anaerolineales bacterium]